MGFLPKDNATRLDECEDRIREATQDEHPGIAMVAMVKIIAVTVYPSCKTLAEVREKCVALAEMLMEGATDLFEHGEKKGFLDHQIEAKHGYKRPDA